MQWAVLILYVEHSATFSVEGNHQRHIDDYEEKSERVHDPYNQRRNLTVPERGGAKSCQGAIARAIR